MGQHLIGLVAVAFLLCAELALSSDPHDHPPRRLQIIGTGKAQSTPILRRWFITEPSTDPLIIPTREWGAVTPEDIERFMRMYFPRSFKKLLNYDFFFLAQVDMDFFSARQEKWLFDALLGYQKGALNTRSTMGKYDTEWRDSILSGAFPNDVVAVLSSPHYKSAKPGRLVVRDGPEVPNVMKPFKEELERIIGIYHDGSPTLYTIPKPGSIVLSYTENNLGIGEPIPGQIAHVFFWRFNRSVTYTFQDMVYDIFWTPREGSKENPFALDIVVNIVWHSTGRKLPSDPFLVHRFRSDLFSFGIRKSLLTSLLEFADLFGANPSKLFARLGGVEEWKQAASNSYLDGDFDGAMSTLSAALEALEELEEDAARLKDQALFWVYSAEWLVTTGTFLVAGVLVYTIMVRKGLYRPVATTRGVGL